MSFLASDPGAKASAYNLLLQTLSHKSPDLHDHVTRLPEHDPDFYLRDLFTGLFTGHLALDQAARLWDVYVFEGDAVLVRAGVAFLIGKEMALLGTSSLADVKAVLDGHENGAKTKQPLVAQQAEEDGWMAAVRSAGKM